MQSTAPTLRASTRLTSWLRYLLYANAVIAAAWLVSDTMQLQLLASAPYSLDAAQANDTRQGLVAALYLLAFLSTVVVFAVWVYRANLNARLLGAQGMQFTPGWAVGWYFIPIAFLWKPYQAMKEIWKASRNPAAWQGEARTALLPWWWFFWIATCLIGNASFRMSLAARTVDQLVASTWVNMAASAASIPSAVLAAMLVRQIYSMQMAHA